MMNFEHIAESWITFAIEVAKDDGTAQAHLDAGRAICYSKNGKDMFREWPDGRIENVRISEDGTITVLIEK